MTSPPSTASSPFLTKRSLGLAGLAAVGACAACCALSLAAAAGIGGALLSSIAAYVGSGLELAVASAVGVGAFTVLAVRFRNRRKATTATCGSASSTAIGSGCGCGTPKGQRFFSTPEPSASEPLVCTADLEQTSTIRTQMDGYRSAFVHLLRTEHFDGGFRWIITPRAGLAAELRTLAENEHQCCRFMKFDLQNAGDSLVWETTASPESAAVLREYAELPRRLAEHPRGQDLAAIKASIAAAGLHFAADERPSPSPWRPRQP